MAFKTVQALEKRGIYLDFHLFAKVSFGFMVEWAHSIFWSDIIYIHDLCMRAVKALASLRICADSPEPSLLADATSI